MTGELFFNGREWRRLLKDEQAVRFLELLYNRAGGAQAPDLNLQEINTFMTTVGSEMTQIKSENNALRLRLQEIENGSSGQAVQGFDLGGYL